MAIYFTSGTTGAPKMVEHTQASYGLGFVASGRYQGLACLVGPRNRKVGWCGGGVWMRGNVAGVEARS